MKILERMKEINEKVAEQPLKKGRKAAREEEVPKKDEREEEETLTEENG